MDPVQISIVGGTGTGGDISNTPPKMLAETPTGQPDFVVNVIRPSIAIVVRFGHLFLTTFVGALTAAGIGGEGLLGAADFQGVIRHAALLSLSVSGMGFLKDLVTVFGRLEGKYPLATGSI